MNDDVVRDEREEGTQEVGVLLKAHDADGPRAGQRRTRFLRFVLLAEVGALQHVEELQLEAPCAAVDGIPHRGFHVVFGLSGEAEDDVGDDRDVQLFEAADRLFIDFVAVTAPDVLRGLLVGGLQAEFDPDRFDGAELVQHLQHFGSEAVRPGGDGQHLHFRAFDEVAIAVLHAVERAGAGLVFLKPVIPGVGAGETLDIGDVPPLVLVLLRSAGEFSFHSLLRVFQLSFQRQIGSCGKVTGPAGRAEETAACVLETVPVRAGAAAVEAQFIELFTKGLFAVVAQRRISHPLTTFLPGYYATTPFHLQTPHQTCICTSMPGHETGLTISLFDMPRFRGRGSQRV